MQRFTELLLLAALLPSSFASPQALLPTLKYPASRRNAVIRGLLNTRQTDFCPSGFFTCSVSQQTCCPTGQNCCPDGSCCDSTTFCDLGSNGIFGCCSNGEDCSGAAPAQSTDTLGGPSPPTDTVTIQPLPETTTQPAPLPDAGTETTSIELAPPPIVQTTPDVTAEPTDLTTPFAPTVTSSSPSATFDGAAPITESSGVSIDVKNPSSTIRSGPETATTPTPTINLLGAAGRAQPYRPLLAFSGILVAVIYCT